MCAMLDCSVVKWLSPDFVFMRSCVRIPHNRYAIIMIILFIYCGGWGGGDSHDRRLTYGVGAVCDDIVDFIFAGVFFFKKGQIHNENP